MKVIVHNDDFGLTYGFSEAILDCHTNGVTTSTSVRVNGTAYKNSLKALKRQKSLGVGLHLNLTDGPGFDKKFPRLLVESLFWTKKQQEEIKNLVEVQFIQAIKKDKLKIDHINSHDHVHMIPKIFNLTSNLCKKYNINYLRLTNEKYYLTGKFSTDIKPYLNKNILKLLLLKYFAKINSRILENYGLKSIPFYGLLHTDNMTEKALIGAFENAKENKFTTIEILTHPVYRSKKDKLFTSKFIENYSKKKNRLIEARALKSKKLKNYLTTNKIDLINFSDL